MDKIERSAYYYKLKADKFEKTGRSHEQQRVHRELETLVRGCHSLEEIQQKMGEQGYFDKPAQALMMDKMASLRDAAQECGFTKVAEIYQGQYDKIKRDPNLMYTDTEYSTLVTKELGRISTICGEVHTIFMEYIAIKDLNVNPCAEEDFNKHKSNILTSITRIQEHGALIGDALNDSYNREHCGIDDAGYDKFKQFVMNIANEMFDGSYKQEFDEVYNRAWEVLKSKKNELVEIARKDVSLQSRSTYLSIPPENAGGEYELVMNVKRPV